MSRRIRPALACTLLSAALTGAPAWAHTALPDAGDGGMAHHQGMMGRHGMGHAGEGGCDVHGPAGHGMMHRHGMSGGHGLIDHHGMVGGYGMAERGPGGPSMCGQGPPGMMMGPPAMGPGPGVGPWTDPGMGPGMARGIGSGMGPGMTGPGAAGSDMLAGLGLSDDQRIRVRKVYDELRRKNWDTMGRLLDERVKLRDLYAGASFDRDALAAVHRRIGELRQQMIEARLDAHAAVEQVLTPEQRDRLRARWRELGPRAPVG